MAVLINGDTGWVISHELYIKNIYKKTNYLSKTKSYSLNPTLFDIQIPFLKKKSLECASSEITDDVKIVKDAHDNLYKLYSSLNDYSNCRLESNHMAKSLADHFYCQLTRHPNFKFLGGNSSQEPLISEIGDELYLIPEGSLFYCYDVRDISDHLKEKEFDFILMDPPWWNKYIRRKRKKNYKFG